MPKAPAQLTPFHALNQAYRKVKPLRADVAAFSRRLLQLLNTHEANVDQREDWHENELRDALIDLLGKEHYINKSGDVDVVIHEKASAKTPVAVLIEVKRPANVGEFVRQLGESTDFNVKAIQELVLYYLRERITKDNLGVKHLIATNGVEWYLFDSLEFDRAFAQNKPLVKLFQEFEARLLSERRTDFFYREIAGPAIASFVEKHPDGLRHVYLDLRSYRSELGEAADMEREAQTPGRKVVALYKLLSATHLLKLPFANDSNTLNKDFYAELLHIIGLEEREDPSTKKRLIARKPEGQRDEGSLLEATIRELTTANRLLQLTNAREYGEACDEQAFGVALALVITWTNRVLFCKLLEAQLLAYHNNDQKYAFLNAERIGNYDDLYSLFFKILARPHDERSGRVAERFTEVPYLNSSLFERTALERQVLDISNLSDAETIPHYGKSVLRKRNHAAERPTLHYLFDFLNAYDFSNEDADAVQEESKNLINASVLGLIFEKINGYKEGSFYTPGFITEYIVRETIRPALVKRFRAATAPDADVPSLLPPFTDASFEALSNYCGQLYAPAKLEAAARVVDTLTVCDPAVGSGHFLVSALNELLSVKSELGLLLDERGVSIANAVKVAVANDELVVLNRHDESFFEYRPFVADSDRVQRTLFEQKRRLIEGCLFGVDINPNSVKICRLRLWIELLKHAYYNADQRLETLPNIDINIKAGNSLIRRFALDADLKSALSKSPKFNIDSYRIAVASYRGARTAEEKRKLLETIEEIKQTFSTAIIQTDKRVKKLSEARGMLELFNSREAIGDLFNTLVKKEERDKEEMYRLRVLQLEKEIADDEAGLFYEDAFEWRFEFPAVLDDDGNYLGFDVVVGNPPYIRQEEISKLKRYLAKHYPEVYRGTADILVYFVHLGLNIAAEGGLFGYIISNKFMRAGYGKELREYLTQFRLRELIDFGDLQVFAEATTYPLIIVAEREPAQDDYRAVNVPALTPVGFRQNLALHRFEGSTASLTGEGWNLTDRLSYERMSRLRAMGVPLGKFVGGKIYYGIKTGYNQAFVIDEATAQRLIDEDKASEEVIKPFLAGRDIKRYVQPEARQYVLYVPWHFPLHEDDSISGVSLKAEAELNRLYPAIYKHLVAHKPKLSARNKAETGIRYEWYALQRYGSSYWREFEKPKIMYQEIATYSAFTQDVKGTYCNNKIFILPEQPAWLLALLNYSRIWEYLKAYGTSYNGGAIGMQSPLISSIPIVEPDASTKEVLDRLVVERMGLSAGDAAGIARVEGVIEGVVRELYGEELI